VDGKPWPARIVADDQDRLVIDLKNIQIGVVKSSTQSIQPTRSGTANSDTLRDPNAITSEIRGKVVKVLVSAHQNVEQDQPIVIVESMKMQATIRCDRAGTVKDVLVTAGNGVKPGDVLVTFD
jgi:pyruvate carboxylase